MLALPPEGRRCRVTARRGRRRPAGGGVVFRKAQCAFECLGCGFHALVHSCVVRDPEAMAQMREALEYKHEECWRYPTRYEAYVARARAKREKMQRKLASQQTSWRGGLCG